MRPAFPRAHGWFARRCGGPGGFKDGVLDAGRLTLPQGQAIPWRAFGRRSPWRRFPGRVGRVVLGRTRLLVRGGAQGVRGREGGPVMEGPATSRRTFLKASAACGIRRWEPGSWRAAGAAGSRPTPAARRARPCWRTSRGTVRSTWWSWGWGRRAHQRPIAAAESGASVLVVDKAPEGSEGGNSRYSSQLFVCHQQGRGTCLRRGACGRLLRARRRAGRLRTGVLRVSCVTRWWPGAWTKANCWTSPT